MALNVLIIDDEESIRFAFKNFLSKVGYNVFSAESYHEAIDIISTGDFDAIFSDILLQEYNGLDILKYIRKQNMNCPVLMITGQPDVATATEAIRLGAFDYLIKPIEKETILRSTKIATDYKKIVDEKSEAERENQKSQKQLEAIFRSVSEAIITFDKNNIILSANEATQKICIVDPNELINRNISELSDLSPCFAHQIFKDITERDIALQEHTISFTYEGDKKKTIVLNSSPLLDSDGVSIGTIVAMRDETKLTLLQKELAGRHKFHDIIGKNIMMQRIYDLIKKLSRVETTILITGESGTGKELIARAVHYSGSRKDEPFICLNCSALSESLLETELFGHVKGAFTGAVKNSHGRFHDAHGGTLFLDEIGDISQSIQLKLLRVLQEKTYERVGDSTPIKTDVRIIAATNRDLKDLISDGKFREDLFYRLKVVEIHLPPLRERTDDIPLLTNHFISRFNNKFKMNISGVSSDVLRMFMRYPWRGNIRELEHAIEHAFVLCQSDSISPDDLPIEISEQNTFSQPVHIAPDNGSVSDQQLLNTLEQTHWNKTETSRLLGISRQTLYRRLKKLNG